MKMTRNAFLRLLLSALGDPAVPQRHKRRQQQAKAGRAKAIEAAAAAAEATRPLARVHDEVADGSSSGSRLQVLTKRKRSRRRRVVRMSHAIQRMKRRAILL